MQYQLHRELLLNTDLSPEKVARNTIEFLVPGGLPGKIILTDSFSTYFCISLQLPRNAPAGLCSQVCPQIRETIMTGLRKASTTLHYSNSVPQYAFLCCEHLNSATSPLLCCSHLLCCQQSNPTTNPHIAVVDGSHRLMTCTVNPAEIYTILTEEHLVWFGSSAASGE